MSKIISDNYLFATIDVEQIEVGLEELYRRSAKFFRDHFIVQIEDDGIIFPPDEMLVVKPDFAYKYMKNYEIQSPNMETIVAMIDKPDIYSWVLPDDLPNTLVYDENINELKQLMYKYNWQFYITLIPVGIDIGSTCNEFFDWLKTDPNFSSCTKFLVK
jgi:hypothetical protein